MKPLIQSYQEQVNQSGWHIDEAQKIAIKRLSRLIDELQHPGNSPAKESFFSRVFGAPATPKVITRGVYFWGGVGRGKTYLLDLFFQHLPTDKKCRIHFHHFMRDVHKQRQQLGDIEDPLTKIAEQYAERYKVICFDEFLVLDITDAMILSKLIGALFVQGVVLVATSNFAPDLLYKDGFQRDRFLPAIELIKRYCDVVCVDNGTDYRLQQLARRDVFWNLQHESADQFKHFIIELAPNISLAAQSIELNSRQVQCSGLTGNLIWFDFDELCNQPLGAADYIELATEYSTIVVSDVYQLNDEHNDIARRLITFIDAVYDNHAYLLLSIHGGLAQLYTGKRLAFEFQRTQSRLHDMQSEQYLAQGHGEKVVSGNRE